MARYESSSHLYLDVDLLRQTQWITLFLWRMVLLGKTDGYFIVVFAPGFPSIHSTVPWAAALARFVTKLYTLSGPVLNRCIAAVSTLFNEDFYNRRMQAIWRVRWCCTSFNIVHACSFVYDNERTSELPHVLVVNTEIRLKRYITFHAFGHIDERSTWP